MIVILSSHFGQVLHLGFFCDLQDETLNANTRKKQRPAEKDFITTTFTPAKINQYMSVHLGQIIILLMALGLWAYSAFPTLKYIVYAAEGDYRWGLAGWFLLLTASIFVVKFSLYSIIEWPEPSTWASRFFFPLGLLLAYLLPFMREYLFEAIRNLRK
jgi:hypothetical protein